MPLKKALDMWWNSVRIKNRAILCYKCTDYSYNFIKGDEWLDEDEIKSYLKMYVQLDDYYEEDEDGYPIIYGKLLLGNE